MSDVRMERIERLLHDLDYEITRGVMEGDLDSETLNWIRHGPPSRELRGGFVLIEFRTRPIHYSSMLGASIGAEPGLKVIKGGKP